MSQIPLYTIGYGAREIDEFVAVLQRYGVAYLLDVRSRPYSRYKPDFNKQTLERRLQAAGIRYVFMGDALGGQPDDPDCYTDGKVDYEKVRQKPFYTAGIQRLRDAWEKQAPAAIMCSEGKPETCHRSKLIGRTLSETAVALAHIDENDQLISQEEALLRLTKGQPSLFGDDFYRFTSRKRYKGHED